MSSNAVSANCIAVVYTIRQYLYHKKYIYNFKYNLALLTCEGFYLPRYRRLRQNMELFRTLGVNDFFFFILSRDVIWESHLIYKNAFTEFQSGAERRAGNGVTRDCLGEKRPSFILSRNVNWKGYLSIYLCRFCLSSQTCDKILDYVVLEIKNLVVS